MNPNILYSFLIMGTPKTVPLISRNPEILGLEDQKSIGCMTPSQKTMRKEQDAAKLSKCNFLDIGSPHVSPQISGIPPTP